jgi:hypothetical protein
MSVDNTRVRHDNQGFVATAPTPALITKLRDTVEGLSVLVLDLDALGMERCVNELSEASEDCLFVLWFPWRYTPADVVTISQRLVDIGATPFERSRPNQTLQSCWDKTKSELLSRIRDRRQHEPKAN